VGDVLYDAVNNPLRMQIVFSNLGPDMQPLPRRKQELFINNIKYESPDDSRYICSEFIRTVNLGRGVSVTDSETLTQYELKPDGSVEGKQRVAIYLTPNPNNQVGTDRQTDSECCRSSPLGVVRQWLCVCCCLP